MIICASCGGELPPQFRFCGYCGAPLTQPHPRSPTHETRRSVTVVFSDLKGSTSLGEQLDSEALREVMTRYFEEMSGALELHGGTVEKYIGDAIMAVFGMPQAHEDDALRAVRAAHEMTRRLEVLNEKLEQHWGVRLTNRTGVNTGPVIASGDASSRQRLVTGDTVNVAARLEQAAPANEVLIGESTYRLVRATVEVEEVEPLELKGKSQRVPAYRLLSVADLGGPHRRHDIPLIGREHELKTLTGALDAAISQRRCGLVTVRADAGVGKSRLLEELASHTRAQGGRFVRGRCLPYGRGITFWPLVEIVGQSAGIAQDDPPDLARAKINALAADAAVADRVAVAVGLSQASFPLSELFWGARKLLEHMAQEQPLVAVVEDVHWAESALLDLLAHIGSTVADAPILLVCATRPELRERQPDWPPVEGALELTLGPLSGEHVDLLVEHLLGGALPGEVRARIVAAAEGNPLFVEQLVAMFIEEGALRRIDDRWVADASFHANARIPASIEALLAGRLDLLPHDELSVVESASVIGLVFAKSPLEELVPGELLPVEETLSKVEAKSLVRRGPVDMPDTFRFDHIMIRDAAYNRLPKRARSGLHVRFADWAERTNRERNRELEFQEIVGYHLEQARRYLLDLAPLAAEGEELGRRAAAQLGPAGRRAFGRGDMPAAANLLRRSVELLPAGTRERLVLLPELGEALMEIGEFAEAQRRVDEAVAGAVALGDVTLESDATLTRLLVSHHTVEDLERWRSDVQRETDRLIPLLERESAAAVLAKAWRMVSFVHGTVSHWQETGVAQEHAIRAARTAGDARQLARLTAAYVQTLAEGPTPALEAIARAEDVLRAGLADRRAEGLALLALAPLHAMTGSAARARELSARGSEMLRDLGVTVLAAGLGSYSAARIELMAGDPGAAETALRGAYETLTAIEERYYRPGVAAALAKTLFALGRLDDAEELATVASGLASPDDVEAQALVRPVQVKLLAALGDKEQAHRLARELLELLRRTDAPVLRADALVDLADAFVSSPTERLRLIREAGALYERKQHVVGTAHVEALLQVGRAAVV